MAFLTSSKQKFRSRRALWFALGATTFIGSGPTACGLAEGLSDVGSSLANPDAALLDSPGRLLARGAYHSLLIDGSLEEGGHVIAVRTDTEEQQIAIIPYLESEPCFISPGHSFDRLSSRVDVELPGVISILGSADSNERGEISFFDFSCQKAFDGFTNATLPRVVFPTGAARGVLSLSGDGALRLINPGTQQVEEITSGVSQAISAGSALWTIEGGQLVIRDSNTQVLDRVGEGVSLFATTGGTEISAAFSDENGMHVWSEDAGVTTLSTTGCLPTSWGVDTIAYLDPCEDRKLAIHTLGSRLGIDSERANLSGPENVIALDRGLALWGQGQRSTEIKVLTGTASETSGSLNLSRLEAAPEPKEGVFELTNEVLSKDDATIRSGNFFENWNGVSGDLVELTRDKDEEVDGLRLIAKGVAQLPTNNAYSARGVLTGFDGTVGQLRLFEKTTDGEEITGELVAKGVPIQAQSVEPETGAMAFIAESEDGYVGDLYVTGELGNGGTALKPRLIDTDVHIETTRFMEQPRALAYLVRPVGQEFAELRVWLIDSDLKLTVHTRVSEYRTVPWPSAGILYAVPAGDDQGLWFSKAR